MIAGPFNPSLLRDAESYLERANVLDPGNTVAQAFLNKVHNLAPLFMNKPGDFCLRSQP